MGAGSYPVLSRNPANVNDATPVSTLGGRYSHYDSTYGWRTLRYVQLHGAVAAAAGSVATLSDQGFGCVTVDRDNDHVTGLPFGGIFIGTVTANYYGFVVVGVGDRAFCSTAGSVAAGDVVVPHASTDKIAVTYAPTSVNPTVAQMFQGILGGFGVFPAADATVGGTVVLLQGA